MEIVANKLVDILLFPPGLNLILLLAGYFLLKRKRNIAVGLFIFSISTLFLFSLPVISNSLNASLQNEPALSQAVVINYAKSNRRDVAIVVLAGGRIALAPEYGDIDTVSAFTLQRIHYAAWLHQKTQFPMLVSGGSVFGEATAEAVLMNQALISAFNIAPKWIEFESKNTAENAQFSAKILARNKISEILLVTHSNHMQRAKIAFEKTGLKVVAAPTVFSSTKSNWRDYFPSAKALYTSQLALHEKVGRFWYAIRYQ